MTVLSTMNRLLISGMIIIDISQGGVFSSIFGSSWNKKHCVGCDMSGWHRVHVKLPPAECGDHGHQIKGREWDCACDLGWRGRLCDEEIPCDKDHGEVKMVNPYGVIWMPQCVCKNNFYGGHDCSVFCENGLPANGKCHCDAGFGGKSCGVRCDHGRIEIIDNKEKCVCQDGYGGVYCRDTQCSNGWTGPKCNTEVKCGEHLSNGHPTSNGCKCDEGWEGRRCTVKVECKNGRYKLKSNGLTYKCVPSTACYRLFGQLDRFNRCICKPGYGGDDCSQKCDEESSDSMDGRIRIISWNPKCSDLNRHKGHHSIQFRRPVSGRMEITSEVPKSMKKTAQSSFNEWIKMFISRLIQKISNVMNMISESIIQES